MLALRHCGALVVTLLQDMGGSLLGKVALAISLTTTAIACGSAQPPPPDATPTPSATARASVAAAVESKAPLPAEPPAPEPRTLPTECAASASDVCTPPKEFVNRLCLRKDQGIALTLFHKQTPWTRAYVRRDMEAWYVAAGRSKPAKLKYAEEVLIVSNRALPKGGIQVSGAGSYDVYRWNGSCVSVMSDEVSLRSPATPDVALIRWKRLADDMRATLEKNQKILYRNKRRRKVCKRIGRQAMRSCQYAEAALSRMIASYVRRGGQLPAPKKVP